MTSRQWANRLYNQANRRSKGKDRVRAYPPAMQLTREWIQERIDRGICEATGLSFDLTVTPGGIRSRNNPLAPSLDRYDNDVGYIPYNTRVVLQIYNNAVGRYGDDALRAFVLYYARRIVYGMDKGKEAWAVSKCGETCAWCGSWSGGGHPRGPDGAAGSAVRDGDGDPVAGDGGVL